MYKLKTTAKFGESGGTKDYEKLENKPQINGNELIGNKTSADLGLQPAGQYLTEETDPTVPSYVKNISENDIASWNNKSEFSGDYDDLTNKPDLSQFITNTVNNLTNYYLKSETYTKTEVNNLIGAIQQFHYEIVQELPQTGASNILYLVPKAESQTQNVYDEYVYANNTWEKIGDTEIDLSGYVTTTQLNTALANYQPKLTAGDNITIDSNNVISASVEEKIIISDSDTTEVNIAKLQLIYNKYLNGEIANCELYSNSYSVVTKLISVYNYYGTLYFTFGNHFRDTNLNEIVYNYIRASVSNNVITSYSISTNNRKEILQRYYQGAAADLKVLTTGNTGSYTPTAGSYNPATAKYAEDQAEAVKVQYSTMPTAGADNLGKIVQYTGTTDSTYTQGHFYIVVSDEEETPTYSWQEISFGGGSTPKAFIINYGDTSVSALAKYQEFLDDMLNGIFDTIVLKADGGGTNDYYICSFTNSNSARNIKLIGWSSGIQTLGTISAWRCIPISAKQVNIMWDANNTVYSVQYEDISKYSTEYIPFNYGRSVGAVLSVGNTNAFTPTSDYNPSTKKYTDDTALATVVADKLTGTSAPTTSTVGYVGQQYTDTTNNNQYVCTAVDTVTPEYTWVQVNGGGSVNTSETIINENGVVNAGTLFFNIDDLKLSGMSDTVKAKLTYLYNRIVAKEYIPQVFVYRTYNQVIAFLSGCSGNQTLYFTAFKQDSYSGNLMYNSCKVTLYITNGIVTGAASAFTDVSWNSLSRSGIDDIKTATGYDTTKTQVLKNVQGVLQWVDEA